PFPFPAPAALLHCTQKTICTRLAMFLLQSHLIFRSLTDRCLIFLCNVRSHSSIFGPSKLTSSYPSEKVELFKFPTVSTIINRTISPENAYILRKWQEKKKREMGEDQFNAYMLSIKKLGKEVHEAIQQRLLRGSFPSDLSGAVSPYCR
ncbi:unnamed protein product, partial [Dicrocoelium dendriticum]